MKGAVLGWILGGILIIGLILFAILLINNNSITGKVTNTQITLLNTTTSVQSSGETREQTLVDENQYLEKSRYYTQTFYVSDASTLFVSINSDNPVNYILLPESDVERYKRDKSYTSYSFRTKIVFFEDNYKLTPGDYAIIITTLNQPANFHLIIKETSL